MTDVTDWTVTHTQPLSHGPSQLSKFFKTRLASSQQKQSNVFHLLFLPSTPHHLPPTISSLIPFSSSPFFLKLT